MSHPERSAERDAALMALLPFVELDGWTVAALRDAAGPNADLLFPGGPRDMIEAYCDLGDRWMEEGAKAIVATRVSDRVRAIIALRLEQNREYKGAVRRALGVLVVPGNQLRAILTAVYGTTLLFWLQDSSEGDGRTLALLDRLLRGVGKISQMRRRLGGLRARLQPRTTG